MVELKETATKGFVDGRGSRASSRGQGIGGVAELDTVREVYEVGTEAESARGGGREGRGGGREGGGGGARPAGNADGTLHVLPVELSSVSGVVELPTSFNEREERRSGQGGTG